VEVRVFDFEGCPNWLMTSERLREALARIVRADTAVVLTRVEAEEPPPEFAGSPIILVDGSDLFPGATLANNRTCRLFPTPEGLAGSPAVEELVLALGDRSA